MPHSWHTQGQLLCGWGLEVVPLALPALSSSSLGGFPCEPSGYHSIGALD